MWFVSPAAPALGAQPPCLSRTLSSDPVPCCPAGSQPCPLLLGVLPVWGTGRAWVRCPLLEPGVLTGGKFLQTFFLPQILLHILSTNLKWTPCRGRRSQRWDFSGGEGLHNALLGGTLRTGVPPKSISSSSPFWLRLCPAQPPGV